MILGVDEAGRGPFIGPMVMAAVLAEEKDIPEGVDDSKKLTKEKREALFDEVTKLQHTIRIIPPKEIDEWVYQGRLNWLEAKHTIDMINELKPKKAIIDCPAKNLEAYKEHIAKEVDAELEVLFKADEKYKVVGAASIIAKVTRDRLIEEVKLKEEIDFGSGYLTDPKTQEFLSGFDPDFPHFRKSWQTYQDLLEKKEQKKLL